MRVATLLLSLHWMPAVADVICSYSRPWSRIDQGERMTLRSFEQCNIAGYVNLRWDVSRFETLESGEVQLSAQFANHGRYKYFEIDGETSDFTALNGNPVYFADEWEGCLDGLCTDAVEFTVYCHDDNENCGGEWFNFGGCDCTFAITWHLYGDLAAPPPPPPSPPLPPQPPAFVLVVVSASTLPPVELLPVAVFQGLLEVMAFDRRFRDALEEGEGVGIRRADGEGHMVAFGLVDNQLVAQMGPELFRGILSVSGPRRICYHSRRHGARLG